MVFAFDRSASGSILSVNNAIRVCRLPANSRNPVVYTLTPTAAAIGATTITVNISPAPSVSAPLIIDDNTPIRFGATNWVVPRATAPGSFIQTITSGTSQAITVQPLTAPIAVGDIATSRGLVELLGVQTMDYNRTANLISIRSQKSGIGNEQRNTMISYSFSVSGWIHQGDYAFRNIITPVFNESGELYGEVVLRSGLRVAGIYGVNSLTIPVQLDQVLQMQFELFAQGVPVETQLTQADIFTPPGMV